MKATQLYRKHNGENSVTSLWCNISLLINMRLTYEDKAWIKLVRQQNGWALNALVKSFLTRIGRSVLLKIFSAKLTRRTWFLERSAWTEADCLNNTKYRACSGADMQPGRQPWVQQKSERDSEVDRNIPHLRSLVWRISKTECIPAGPVSTNNWSTKPLISGDPDWKL